MGRPKPSLPLLCEHHTAPNRSIYLPPPPSASPHAAAVTFSTVPGTYNSRGTTFKNCGFGMIVDIALSVLVAAFWFATAG